MLTQSSGIHLTTNPKNIIQVILFFHSHILSYYQTIEHLQAFAERCYIDQKQNRMLF